MLLLEISLSMERLRVYRDRSRHNFLTSQGAPNSSSYPNIYILQLVNSAFLWRYTTLLIVVSVAATFRVLLPYNSVDIALILKHVVSSTVSLGSIPKGLSTS